MKYYTSEKPLKLKEYGRNIQNMVLHAKTLKDPVERQALVNDIIRMMALLNPALREHVDYKQKLWDQLFYLADFDLDVKSEFPMPKPELVLSRPKKRMEYNNKKSPIRSYGRNVHMMVLKAIDVQDPEEKLALVTLICNIMKWNIKGSDRDATVEEAVLDHLQTLSNGKLRYTSEQIVFSKVPPTQISSGLSASKHNKPTGNFNQGGYPSAKKPFNKFASNNKKKYKKF